MGLIANQMILEAILKTRKGLENRQKNMKCREKAGKEETGKSRNSKETVGEQTEERICS